MSAPMTEAAYELNFETKSENYGSFEGKPGVTRPELRVPSTWQKFNRETGLHPTQKPVALMEYIVKTYSNEGDIVLDNAMGSGTVGVACRRLNRRFVGIELNPTYYATASARINSENMILEGRLL